MLEYYGFFLYGTAASLVLGPLFFPSSDPSITALAVFASVGAGFIARPIGAVVLGIVGDKLGRRFVLSITLILMGGSTFLMGVLPTYQDVGMTASLMLIVLRFSQGIAVSGQHSSASSLALELADIKRRGLYASLVLSGTQAGLILASVVLLFLSLTLSHDNFMSWGWRVPFWLGFIIVGFGIWIHLRVPESPGFLAQRNSIEGWMAPLRFLLARGKRDIFLVIIASQVSVVSSIVSVYSLSWAVNHAGIPMASILLVQLTSALVGIFAIPVWAYLSDRIGRRPVFTLGTVASGILVWPYFHAINEANILLVFVFGILLSGVAYSAVNGVWPAMYGEMFTTRIRITGMAIGTQIGFAIAAQAPVIAEFLSRHSPDWRVAPCLVGFGCLASVFAVSFFRETSSIEIDDLGEQP